MQITFEFPNIGRAIAAFSQDLTPAMAGPMMTQYIPRLVERIKGKAPKKTSALAESIYSQPTGTMEWGIYEGVQHGKWVREGTRAHPIYPLHPKEALWWVGIQGGRPVSGAPGNPGITKKNEYHIAAVEESAADLQDLYGEMFKSIGAMLRF